MGHKAGKPFGGKRHAKGSHRYEPSVEVDRGKITHTDWTYAALKADCCDCHIEAHDAFGCITCACQKRHTSPRQAPDDPAWVRIERLVAGKAFHKKVK